MDKNPALAKAIELLGGVVKAAIRLDVPGHRYQTVQQWLETGSVPPKYCPRIERELDGAVRCEELRADVDWAYLRGTDCPAYADHRDPNREIPQVMTAKRSTNGDCGHKGGA